MKTAWIFVSLGLAAAAGTARAENAAPAAPPPGMAAPQAGSPRNFFIRNDGQFPAEVEFYVKGASGTVFLASSEVVYDFSRKLPPKPGEEGQEPSRAPGGEPENARYERLVFRCELVGTAPGVKAAGEKMLPGKINYFIGPQSDWKSGIPTFEEVVRRGVYSGITQVFFLQGNVPASRFLIEPGADPALAAFRYSGVESVEVGAQGELFLGTAFGVFREPPLKAWQELEGKEVPVAASRELRPDGLVGFRVGDYRKDLPLHIE